MTTFTSVPKQVEEVLERCEGGTSRREFLRSAGLLVVSFSSTGSALAAAAQTAGTGQAAGLYPDPDFRQLDSWIVIHQDNSATFYVGKTDCGQGTGTAFRQVMSDELDIAYDKTKVIMGSTDGASTGAGAAASEPRLATHNKAASARRPPGKAGLITCAGGACARWA